MLLSTIIVHYRSLRTLPDCLRALARATGGLDAEVVVVDNDSRDGVAGALAGDFPAVRVIASPRNEGYARGVNRGIAATSGEFALILNPDCYLEPGSVRALLDHMSTHPRTAIAGPQLRNLDGSIEYSARTYPAPATLLFNRYSLLTRLFPGNRWSRRYLMSDWDHASPRDVDWVSGACMLVRRTAVEAVGPMDGEYFLFVEDVDWCRRMTSAGWTVRYVADARATHEVGASRNRVPARIVVERHRGMIRYLHKHHPLPPVIAQAADATILLRAGWMLTRNAMLPREPG